MTTTRADETLERIADARRKVDLSSTSDLFLYIVFTGFTENFSQVKGLYDSTQ